MSRYLIDDADEITADRFTIEGPWIVFRDSCGPVRAIKDVTSIKRLDNPHQIPHAETRPGAVPQHVPRGNERTNPATLQF